MKLLFMGPPGAGKGTQAQIICDELEIPQISTGEILRAAVKAGTEMGRKAQEFMNAGKLVPDEVVIGIVRDRLKEPDAAGGYILDGFPRTIEQAQALDRMLSEMGQKLDAALNLKVDDAELIKRLLDRAQKDGRKDDTEPVIKNRLEVYNQATRPLIEYYEKAGLLRQIDGKGSLEEISERIRKTLNELR
ncbi:MAG: adenylate kinase [Spirochaetales bacterium]|nr:adenylate kinase [Leptospiraceae bacterium]MCP5480125.1 adenylate kinase [Spirochaetales bacterium]MCP5485535.1 adenylate kinase [Spirochaetales bacterium]